MAQGKITSVCPEDKRALLAAGDERTRVAAGKAMAAGKTAQSGLKVRGRGAQVVASRVLVTATNGHNAAQPQRWTNRRAPAGSIPALTTLEITLCDDYKTHHQPNEMVQKQ
jgi:hypothetical protein